MSNSEWGEYYEKKMVALLFEVASIGVSHRHLVLAIDLFDVLMEAAPEMELPLVGAGYMLILRGQHKKCLELLNSRENQIKERTALYDAAVAHSLFLSGRVGEAERLLEVVVKRKDEAPESLAFANNVLEEIRSQYRTGGGSDSMMGMRF